MPPLAWKAPHIEESKLESTSRKLDFPSQPLTGNGQSDQLPVISEESEEEIIMGAHVPMGRVRDRPGLCLLRNRPRKVGQL